MYARRVTRALTDQSFWEQDYIWADLGLPDRPNPDFSFDRTLIGAFDGPARPERGESVLEIGCAPAKWMVHLAEHHGARVQGVEYSPKGAQVSRDNLAACGVQGTIHTADFFGFEANPVDMVVSLGFIEHFDDTEDVFARHVELVRPGGRLVLGVPNFIGVNGLLQRLGDRPYLELHNRRAMNPRVLRAAAARHGLSELFLRHLGGPDPVIVRSRRAAITMLVLAGRRFRRLALAERLNHRLVSSYLLGVWRKAA